MHIEAETGMARRPWYREPEGRWAALLAVLALAHPSCAPRDDAPLGEPACTEIRAPGPQRVDVVLVVSDTLRRDATGAYGGAASTPHFDAFAADHLRFERAISAAPWTKPSIASLFTSLLPSRHGVASDPQMREDKRRTGALQEMDVLSGSLHTLAEVLQTAGFQTAGFVTNPWLDARGGFDQGFDHYDDSFADWSTSGDAAVEAAIEWLGRREAGRPYFLYLHLLDSHRPYGAIDPQQAESLRGRLNGDPYDVGLEGRLLFEDLRLSDGTPLSRAGFRPTRAVIREAYRRGVEQLDLRIGRFLSALRRDASWRQTAVLITSDHGEALFERGYGEHGEGLLDDEVAVPLVARLPGAEPARGRIECLVGLVDVMPTLCAYLGARCPEPMEGWSFVAVDGRELPAGRRFLVTEGVMRHPRHRSIRDRSFKLVFEPDGSPPKRDEASPYRLYDLERDPLERFDALDPLYRTERSERAYADLRQRLPQLGADPGPRSRERALLAPDLRRRLQELGYLQD
jgi:arylsulfatase